MKILKEITDKVIGIGTIAYCAVLVVIAVVLPVDLAIWSIQWFMRLIGVAV
jgi:hypothetical protein